MCGKPKVDTSAQDFQRQEAERARQEEEARQARIAAGMTQIGQVFGGLDGVIDQRRGAMEGFYLPQLDKRFGDAKEDLTFALSRAGQLTSSVAGEKQADLSEAFGLERARIESDIAADLASTRGGMNQQRAAIEAALRSSGDATAASNAALAAATNFRQDQPTLNPIGDIFGGVAMNIGAARDGYEAGRIRDRLKAPSPVSRGSGRVVA